jgi:hypothetical protein
MQAEHSQQRERHSSVKFLACVLKANNLNQLRATLDLNTICNYVFDKSFVSEHAFSCKSTPSSPSTSS